MRISDWSSDVCSSDLPLGTRVRVVAEWPCRDDHALVVVAQVIDHEGRDAFVPLAVEAGTRAEAGHALAHEDLPVAAVGIDRVRSEEHTSELQSLMRTSYAVFCLKKKNT